MAIVLTNSARFSPFTFDEILKPYQMMADEYRTLESGISELETKAETMRQWAERNPNSEYALDYNDYASKLEKAANDLSTKGLQAINRKSILDLNKNYATKIKPIEDAAAYVKEKAKEQQTLVNSSKGRIRFDRDFNSTDLNLQDVIDSNNTLGYNIYDLDRYAKDAIIEGTALKNAETPVATEHPENSQYNIVSQGLAANDPRIEAKVQEILQTIPENLRPEIESEIRANVTNAAAVTSKLEANRGYKTPSQINSIIKSDNALTAKMAEDGYKLGKGNQWIPDLDSPTWIIKGVIPQYVKDKDGNIELDTYGNPKIKFVKGTKPGTDRSGAQGGGAQRVPKLTSGQSYTIMGVYNTEDATLKSGYLDSLGNNPISGDIINMADLNDVILKNDSSKAVEKYSKILDNNNVIKNLRNKYNLDKKDWRNKTYIDKLKYLKSFIEEMTFGYGMDDHIIQYDEDSGIIKMRAITYQTSSPRSSEEEPIKEGSSGKTQEGEDPVFNPNSLPVGTHQ